MATIPLSISLQAGVMKRFPSTTVPVNVNQAVLVLDASWLTDPTAFITWGIEVAPDGVTWQHYASGSRPGGPQPAEGGGTTTNLDLEVSLVHIHGWGIRAFMGYTLGDTGQPASASVTGTLTLS